MFSSNCNYTTTVRDPINAFTHFVGIVASIIMTAPLLIHVKSTGASPSEILSYLIFMIGAILMYGASTAYHTFDLSEKSNILLKKIDHCMIPIMIAGSYTPVCRIALWDGVGKPLLIAVWTFAIASIIFKLFWVTCPKWVSSLIYICMGWSCVYAIPQLLSTLPKAAFLWLLAGGIAYTAGGIFYALKPSWFEKNMSSIGNHEIFHIFVMAGSMCHYVFMYHYLPLI